MLSSGVLMDSGVGGNVDDEVSFALFLFKNSLNS
jgi:hypothetical protein